MLHFYIAGLGIVVALFVLGILQTKQNRATIENAIKTVAKVAKTSENAADAPVSSDLALRVASLERGFEELQADARRYLAKANTRLRRARELSGEEEEDDDNQEVAQFPNGAFPQIPIPFNAQNGEGSQDNSQGGEYDPLDEVQQRISQMR